MRNHKSKTFYFLIVLLTFVFLLLIWSVLSRDTKAGELDNFAQCLTNKNIIMYGAEWCPHCQNQKKMFGKSFERVSYVECPRDPQKCLAAGIEGYPTWIMPSGEKLVGEQSLETLSQTSGCPIENIKN